VMLRRSAIQEGKVFLYQSKTGLGVQVPVPADVVGAIEKIVGVDENHCAHLAEPRYYIRFFFVTTYRLIFKSSLWAVSS
jgi:hypothetical protein